MVETTVTGDAAAMAVDAIDALRRVVRALRVADDESESTLGMTAAQLFVLREIQKAGTITVGELAERLATAQSSASEVVARLDAKLLVRRWRSHDDRRRVEIGLSEWGRTVLTHAPETVQERLLAAFARLPEERQRDVAEGMRVWIDEAGLGDVPATMFFEPLR